MPNLSSRLLPLLLCAAVLPAARPAPAAAQDVPARADLLRQTLEPGQRVRVTWVAPIARVSGGTTRRGVADRSADGRFDAVAADSLRLHVRERALAIHLARLERLERSAGTRRGSWLSAIGGGAAIGSLVIGTTLLVVAPDENDFMGAVYLPFVFGSGAVIGAAGGALYNLFRTEEVWREVPLP